MDNAIEFKWVWKTPDLRNVKQPDILTPEEMIDLIERVDNVRVDPLLGLRNQCMLAMTFFSCFRAIEVSQWKVKECLYPDGSICHITHVRKDGTKGKYPMKAPVVIQEQREMLDKWLNARVKHRIKLDKSGSTKYRGLDPESHVFLSNWRGVWQNFSLTRKVSKGKEYLVATAVQNLLSKLYKEYGFPRSSSHAGRHSMARFAEKLLNKKNNPHARFILQNLLHHRCEEAQNDYTEVIDYKRVKAAHQAMLPKPKKRGRPKKGDKYGN
ncbi:hypothetical protein [Pseudoalteromonas sp. MMG024]|uniref:hypothetical protein n=1 Tax=Pseudoalteromonas sp. MMG024 TaxID=2909980 RepID=UPI001F44F53F|nr:hypothetical protein [Pseudoalteromonas sp. MMG024]MCF6459089.1 hypothetical protein [Pseudoalteromonas sp. MMG024]